MIFEMHEPRSPLDDFCAQFIYYKGFQPAHRIERVVPDGCSYLIFELDGITRHLFDNESLQPTADFREAWLSGAQNEYISISAHNDSEMFVIQFKPGGAARLIGGDISKFSNRVVDGKEIFGDKIGSLRKSLVAAETPTEKFEVARRFLVAEAKPAIKADRLVCELVQAIQANATTQLQEIISESDYSQKQLIHHFRTRVGLTPKVFQAIARRPFSRSKVVMKLPTSFHWQIRNNPPTGKFFTISRGSNLLNFI